MGYARMRAKIAELKETIEKKREERREKRRKERSDTSEPATGMFQFIESLFEPKIPF